MSEVKPWSSSAEMMNEIRRLENIIEVNNKTALSVLSELSVSENEISSLKSILEKNISESAMLKRENERYRKALEFYSNENSWWAMGGLHRALIEDSDTEIAYNKCSNVGGKRARKALNCPEAPDSWKEVGV